MKDILWNAFADEMEKVGMAGKVVAGTSRWFHPASSWKPRQGRFVPHVTTSGPMKHRPLAGLSEAERQLAENRLLQRVLGRSGSQGLGGPLV